MIPTMTREAFVQAMRTGTEREQELHIVVARLLAIALKLADGRELQASTFTWPLPDDYHVWPMAECELESSDCRQRLRFYVSPKAAALSDDAPFPVGTVFVVETADIELNVEQLVSWFVMGKYADVIAGRLDRMASYGAWGVATSTYGPDRELPASDAVTCGGTCRLPQA